MLNVLLNYIVAKWHLTTTVVQDPIRIIQIINAECVVAYQLITPIVPKERIEITYSDNEMCPSTCPKCRV